MILVTGATGHFGNATIQFLLDKGIEANQITAFVRSAQSADAVKEKGVNIVIGDYDNYDSLVSAFKGVEKLLFVSGSDIFKRAAQHQNVIEAAKEVGVKHIVYTSFLTKNETTSSPLWQVSASHLQTEDWLKESVLEYTILKNTLYMDLVPAFVGDAVLESGVVYLPAGNGYVAAVLRSEMAEATANILISTNHGAKVYDFCNTEAFSYQDVAQYISEITGKTINYISPTTEEYAQTLAQYGVPQDFISLFSGFAVAQAKGELDIISTDLEKQLGRKPTSIKSFLNQIYSQVKN